MDLVTSRKDAIIHYWEVMKERSERRFEIDGQKIAIDRQIDWRNWQGPLFLAFREAVETTASSLLPQNCSG